MNKKRAKRKTSTSKRTRSSISLMRLKNKLVRNLSAIGFESESLPKESLIIESTLFTLATSFSIVWIKRTSDTVGISLFRPRSDSTGCNLEYQFETNGTADVSGQISDLTYSLIKEFQTWDDGIAHFLNALMREVQRIQKDTLAMARRLRRRKWPYVK